VNSREKWDVGILAIAVAFTRLAFRSHDLYDIDSVNFALGIGRFDPRTYQPHPPGYFLYVLLGRAINLLFHDPNLALVLLSVASSIGVVTLTYLTALDWFDRRSAQLAGLLYLFSPLAWFHGTVALTYSIESFFSALLGYLCWKICQAGSAHTHLNANERNLSVVLVSGAGFLLGIAAGIRPSSLLFLGPIFLYSLRRTSLRNAASGVAVLTATLLGWGLPMLRASGGVDAYYGALASLWRLVPSRDTVFNSSPATSIARACFIVLIYALSFGAASVAPLTVKAGNSFVDKEKKAFTAVWVLPGLCFFTFIFLKFVNSGYLLLLIAPGCIWLGFWIAEWYAGSAWTKFAKLSLVGLSCSANVAIFLLFPGYCSYRSVRSFEAELRQVTQGIYQVGPPKDLIVVSFDNHFLGYRHAGYYLPDYVTLQYPAVNLIEGPRIFAMQGDDTSLLTQLPHGSYSRFVLCPLPAGDAANTRHIEEVIKLIPSNDLDRIELNGHEFVTAPIRDLPLLFPKASSGAS
jgi:4-amino-4-deoxy-L-arabinose transferase-like glycosyltransferase